jgi:hypothetical protein
MIGALVTLLSLNLTSVLINAGQTFGTPFPITGATTTTPVTVTSPSHGVPPGQPVHGVSSGVGGMPEANGLFVFTVVDPNTFALYSVSAQGIVTPVVGVNAYTGGGQIAVAFPDFGIRLGRRHVDNAPAVASPRVVFVPMAGREWGLEASGGANMTFASPYGRGTLEQQAQRQNPRLATAHTTFEVHVYGRATPPDPDFGDFDATTNLRDALWGTLFDAQGAGIKLLKEWWPSQVVGAGSQTQAGQHWAGIVEIQQPVDRPTLASFVPSPLSLQFTVEPVNPGSTDPVVFTMEPVV